MITTKYTIRLTLVCLIGILTLTFSGFSQQMKLITPSKAQAQWAKAEIGALIHFDLVVYEPTYNFRGNWNYHPSLSIFNPKELDTDQWVKAAKSAGATYIVLVAKHCSGFSLWPTKAHEYSVKNTPWKNGQGDIVKDFMNSCKKYGIKPGIYASTTANGFLKVDNPGRVVSGNQEEQQRYNEIVKTQLTELWSNYGQLFEIWFDGGVLPPEKGGFDVLSMVNKYQPEAIAFQGPYGYNNNIRWVGNEEGVAPYPCWATADSTTSASGVVEIKGLNGNPDGEFWCPGESDFPLRLNSSFQGGWFWKSGEDQKIFSVEQLIEKYDKSVGRNTNMLIGIVVDDRGLVPDSDVKRLSEFGTAIQKRFSNAIGESIGKGNEFVISFSHPQKVNCAVISENILMGERVRKYIIEGEKGNKWIQIVEGQSIGNKRIENFKTDTFSKIRLRIVGQVAVPNILAFNCYNLN